MANPAGPGAPDPRTLSDVAQEVVVDLSKLVAGLHAAGADPHQTQMLTQMTEMLGALGQALSQGPVGQMPVDHTAGPQEAQGPQGPQGAAPPMQAQAPAGMPMHGSSLPQHSMATPPSAQGAPGQGPAHGGIHTAANHLKVAMQAAKAAAAAHAALGAQAAGETEPAPGAGKPTR